MHNTRLKWKRDDTREVRSAEGWRVNWSPSFVQVEGSCPRCNAPGQSEFTGDDGDLDGFADAAPPGDLRHTDQFLELVTIRRRPAEYVLRMECRCGDDVHAKDKNGCGAVWNVKVSR